MDLQGLKVNISADVQDAVKGIGQVTDATVTLAKEGVSNITATKEAFDITTLSIKECEKQLASLKELASSPIGKLNPGIGDSITQLEARIAQLNATAKNIPPTISPVQESFRGFSNATDGAEVASGSLLNTMGKQRQAFVNFARFTDRGALSLRSLTAVFSIFGPATAIAALGIYEIVKSLEKATIAEQHAAAEAKKLAGFLVDLKSVPEINAEATGTETGNIDRVRSLIAIIQDTNSSYTQQHNALLQLRETNKAYFGDLTLAEVLNGKAAKAADAYSQALITEAIIKGQLENISKVSSELEKQILVYNRLKQAKDVAEATARTSLNDHKTTLGSLIFGKDVTDLAGPLRDFATAQKKFDEVSNNVGELREQLAGYSGALKNALKDQAEQKPLKLDPVDHDANKFAEALKAFQEFQNKYQEIDEDAITKAFTIENASYLKLQAAFKGHAKELQLLEAANSQARLNIIREFSEKYASEVSKTFEEGGNKTIEATNEYIQKSEDINVGARHKELDAEQAKFDKLLTLQTLYNQDSSDLVNQHLINVAAINKKFDNQEINEALNQADRQSKLQQQLKAKGVKPIDVSIFGTDFAQGNEILSKQLDAVTKQLEAIGKAAGVIQPVFDALFTSIEKGSGNIAQALGRALEQIITKLVEAVVEAAIFSAIINVIAPGSGVGFKAIFGQLSGLGGLLNTGKGGQGFAQGGIATGPQSGYLALLHGTEYVLNQKQANNLKSNVVGAGNGPIEITIDSQVQGEHIYQVVKKVTQRKGRTS